ncbi:hypothetical protein MAR_027111 [Mya arenaria]|uniref:Uncharacterized protein n=1 Tax=Mya arenaria TaxID=6604 RepID=A0ABY7EVT6_MYAAR|nr:hypothetical protein MAR_027111 [Mya arenaria]
MLCFMNRQCVDVDNSSCPTYEGNECGLFEVLCYEGIPSLEYCSSECRLEPITVNLALDGDFYTVTRGLTDYEIKEDVRNMFSSFGISVQYISNIKVLPGSIIIALDLSPFPEMDSYLLVIKEHFQNGGTFSINGHVLPLLHGRLHFDWIEHNVENYTTCLENEELCLDSDGTAYCSNVGCVIDDPECNGENELYCFMSKSCVNMDTLCTDDKPCLTSEFVCVDEGGETFCSEEPCDTTTTTTPTTTSTKTTTTTESSEITDPPGPASFHATIRLVLEIRYQKIIMPANTDNGSTAMEEFKSRMRAQLEEQVFRTVQFDAIGVTAQPGDPDGDTIALYIKGRHPPEEGIQNLIMEKLGVAKLYGEHGDSIGIRLDGISYAKVFDEVPNTFFVLPDPIVRDQEYSFMLSDILPTDITDIPSELDIDCGENSVEFKNTVDVRAFVFLTVPQTLDALASDVEILLNKEQIDLEEDSGCTGFPEDLFSFQTPVDEIITVNENWHLDQISDEMILKAKQGVGNIIEAITKRAFMEKIRAVNRTSVGVDISRASLLTERQQMKAKLRLDSRDVEDSGFRETHIYSRPQSLKICPSKDFSGSFILNIGDGKFLLDVTVLPTPDRPHRIPSVADIDIHNVFAYPMVPSAIAEPEVPVFSVGEIASNLFFDTDSDSSLGLAFFGYLPSEIGGRWEYSSDEETWIAFAEVQPPSSRSELRDVITLGSSYFFRFTPDETCNAKCIPETEPDTAPRDDCDIPCGLNECVDCEGIPNGGKSVGDISPRFAYQADDIVLNIRANGIKLAVNATGTSGQFAVECEGVSTADHDEFFQVIQQPQLTGISPDSADIDQLGDVTITGSSLLLVQNIYCVANMYNSDTDASFRTVKAVLGVDGDTIKCSMKDLLGPVRRGKTFKVGVTLMEPSTALMKRVDSFVEFTVVMPAPSVVSAVLDTSGCNKIKLTFDQPISKGVDEQCANYLSSTTLSDLSLTDSVCMVYGNTLVMKYATVIPDGSVLTLKENAIAHAFEFNTENIHYASGQVTLQADTSGEGTPDVLILRDRIPDVVGCTDVAIVLRVSNAGCWNPTYSWTITVENQDTATEEVTASIAQLEEASRKNVFVINATMMVDNILYSFTVTWEAGPHSGTDTVNIRRDASLEAMVNIYGVQQGDLVDADSRIPLSCDLETCVEVNGIEYEWSVDPVYVIPDNAQKRRPVIPSGWLKYDTEHEVTCKVKYSGQDISTSVTFTTKPKSLEPRITVSGQAIHSPSIEHTFAEDLQLGCMDLEDAMNTENLNCIYMCENNLYGEETFLPCRELVNGQVEDVVRDGLSAVVPANDRIKPSDRDLKEKWTLTLQRGKSTKSTTLEIQYKSVPIVVKAPVINVKDNVLAVKSSDETLTIKARCKQMKKYVWNPESAKDNADLSLMPLHESDLLDGRLERALQYDEMLSFPCGIEIDLTRFSLVPGEQYGLVIEGYNVQDGYQLTARELIRISVVSVPIAGSIEIFYDGNELRALSTPITIQLHNWWDDLDGDDLRCWFYYFAEGGVEQDAIKLNPHPNSLLQGLKDFTLPEGNFKVGARCCNSYRMCSSALTETTLSVTAIESQNIVTIVFDLGKLVINAFLDLSSNDLTLEESEQTDQVLTDASNDAITDALEDVEDDIEYGFEVLGSSSAVVKQNPAAISSETKDSIMRTGSELGRRRTGQSVNRRRKRRSTECQEYSNPSGIQQTQAVTLLEAYDVTISETTMSSVEANLYLNLIENIMIGMCQAFSGLDAWTAPAEKAYVRVHTTDMSIIGTGDVLVSCANCAEVTHPAKCLMWLNDDWLGGKCTETDPTFDSDTGMNITTCTVFEILKTEDTTDMSSTTATNSAEQTTVVPSKSIQFSTDFLLIVFTFTNNFDVITSMSEFKDNLKQQIYSQTGVPVGSIQNLELKQGSIIVSFELIESSGSKTLGQMAYTLETTFTSNSVSFTSPDGQALTFKTGSFAYTEKSLDDENDDDDDSNGKDGSDPAPPTYSAVPPPPAYYNPPATNKWVENEIDVKQDGRAASDLSNRSSSSFEKRLQRKANEQTPMKLKYNYNEK